MSRQIANDHPWTDEEIRYFLDRNQESEVEKNRQMFPAGKQPEEIVPEDHSLTLDQDIFEQVNGLQLDQLKSELKKYDLDITGDAPTLKKRLAQHLQEQRELNGSSSNA